MSSQLMWFATRRVCAPILAPFRRTRTPMIQAAAPRKRGGQGEARNSNLVATWTGTTSRNSRTSPKMRRAARAFIPTSGALTVAVFSDAVKLHAVVHEAEAELLRNAFLKRFQLIVDEFDDVTCLDVDQMIVMRFRGGFVARPSVAEFVPLEDSGLFEQADRTVYRGDRYVGIDRCRPRMQRLDVRMILTVTEHARDGLALLGDPQALVGTKGLDVDVAAHEAKLSTRPRIVQRDYAHGAPVKSADDEQ